MPTSPIPSQDGLLLLWLETFPLNLPSHKTALALTDDEIDSAQADCAALTYEIQVRVPAARSFVAEVVARKDAIKNGPIGTPAGSVPTLPALPAAPPAVPNGVLPRLRLFVQAIKASPGYTNAIGHDLGIIATPGSSPAGIPGLEMKSAVAGDVIIKWNKSTWTGVKVQGRAQGGATWTELGNDLFSPFVDSRALATPGQPETREYRMCYLDKDVPSNVWSSVLVVTVTP